MVTTTLFLRSVSLGLPSQLLRLTRYPHASCVMSAAQVTINVFRSSSPIAGGMNAATLTSSFCQVMRMRRAPTLRLLKRKMMRRRTTKGSENGSPAPILNNSSTPRAGGRKMHARIARAMAAAVSLAPIAVEHLGKAALWKRHPTLLTPLDRSQEASLVALALNGGVMESGRLRTIGLADVISRLSRVYPDIPVGKDDIRALIDARNGALHLGEIPWQEAQETLSTALTLLSWMLPRTETSEVNFYRDLHGVAQDVLDKQATEIEKSVKAKIHLAKERFESFRDDLNDDLRDGVMRQIEEHAYEQSASCQRRLPFSR